MTYSSTDSTGKKRKLSELSDQAQAQPQDNKRITATSTFFAQVVNTLSSPLNPSSGIMGIAETKFTIPSSKP